MIGMQIKNRYQINCEIGQGGMGTVYKGYDTALKRDVAIKMITETKLGTLGRSRLLHEARAIAQLSHPNIITVYDVGEYEKSPFIVMEYVEGVNLYDQPPTNIESIVVVAQQVSSALAHAHEHGIIHRDLKPENVILTADGSAKLMDFGLARSISSRLTSEGTILGTVFYLAPEQAQGKPIDPRSDLYSLGVMLYELTTGELPFTAEDPLAVVSQHIHAPVVPPRTKNDQIPPSLEVLILALMAKDPADRPVSALQVVEQLSAPEMLDRTALPRDELSVLNRIVRGRMVGREQELSELCRAWGQAMDGQGQLLLISGEPGVGKTRLMREIVTQSEVCGGQAFIGESQPEGNAPYAAFAQIIRRALRAHHKDELTLPNLVMGELISIAPELQVDYPDISPNPALEPESEQRRLFECIFRFFCALVAEKPTLLVLEDIHWADSGTLSLLQFLARRCQVQPVMLLCTYREVELDEALPFYQTMLSLKRMNLGKRLKIERLSEDKTRDMLAVIFNTEEITPEFLAGIYQETEGNPFFIEEVCKDLIENGQVYFDGEHWQRPPDMAEMDIPQSIKVAVQSRVSKLNESTKDILRNAAVIGREFGFELLQRVTKIAEDELIDGLESALRSQLIEEIREADDERFSFSHALIPTALQDSLSGMRKTRLHRKVAQVMEVLLPEAYQRLAYHWGEGGHEEKALAYTIRAADKAKKRFAHGDAIRLYGEVLDFLADNDERRFDLLKARTEIFNMIGDRDAQRAEVEAMLAMANQQADHGKQVDALHALVELNLQTDVQKALEPAETALEISQKMGDLTRQAKLSFLISRYYYSIFDFQQAIHCCKEAIQIARKAGMKHDLLNYLSFLSNSQWNFGRREASIATAQEAAVLGKAINDPRSIMISTSMLAVSLSRARKFDEALPLIQTAIKLATEIGDLEEELTARIIFAVILKGLGRWKKSEEANLNIIQDFDLLAFHRVILAVHNLIDVITMLGEYEKYHNFVRNLRERARQNDIDNLNVSLTRFYSYSCSWLGKYEEGLREQESIWPIVEKSNSRGSKIMLLNNLAYCSGSAGDFDAAARYLEKSQRLSAELEDSNLKASVSYFSAFVSLLNDGPLGLKEGLDQIDNAIAIRMRLGCIVEWEAYSLKARIHLALLSEDSSHTQKAILALENSLKVFDEYRVGGCTEFLFYTAWQVYQANGFFEEADDYLRKAYERVMLVAGKIKDDDLRKSFMENVLENRAILKEAKAQGWTTEYASQGLLPDRS
jgi:predicted ATPase/predicted Ser/Thr protein kinase